MSEHTVAIVSFEGALKREIKRVREYLKRDETMSSFKLGIEAKGRLNDGEVNLSYIVSDSEYTSGVTGSSLQACLDELLRRNGWEKINAPKALSYEKIPSDATDEIPF